MILISVHRFPSFGRKSMNSAFTCGKLVDKSVNKFVEKMWLRAVDFVKVWNFELWISSFSTKFSTISQKYTNNVNKFCTEKLRLANLLFVSFPRFTQTSTITITIFN